MSEQTEATFTSASSKSFLNKVEKQLCFLCEKAVYANEGKVVDGRTFHPNCASKYWQKQAEEQRAKNRAQPKGLLEGISQQQNLHHVETADKSQPQVEAVPNHSNVMDQVQKVELKELNHVETVDKGAPKIDKNVHVKKSARPKVLNEIKEFKGFAEAKAEYEKQAQAKFDAREKLFEGIQEKHELHHVETHDTSVPHVESVPIRKNNHSQVMEQIQKVELAELHHVNTVDKAGPVIEKNTHIKKDVRPQLFDEIKTAPQLSAKKSAYEQQVANSQNLGSSFKNREGSDTAELTGLAKNKRAEYEQSVEKSSQLPSSAKGKEGTDAKALESGITQKVKEQYQKDVDSRNQQGESMYPFNKKNVTNKNMFLTKLATQLEKDGDKVVYKNLPPKKDLNDLI